MSREARLRRVRRWMAFFICGLVLSGLTAFPLEWEVGLLHDWALRLDAPASLTARLWVDRLRDGDSASADCGPRARHSRFLAAD